MMQPMKESEKGKYVQRTYTVGEREFPNLAELAKAAGLSYQAAYKRMLRGFSDVEIFYGRRKEKVTFPKQKVARNPVMVAGVRYESIYHAYLELRPKADYNAVRARLHMGWTREQALEVEPRPDGRSARSHRLEIRGEVYSVLGASKKFNVPTPTIHDRLLRGATPEQAVGLVPIARGELRHWAEAYASRRKTPRLSYTVDGQTFSSASALARAYGRDVLLVHNRLRAGWSPERAVKAPPSEEVVVDGVTYRSALDAFRQLEPTLEVTYATFQARRAAELPLRVCLGLDPLPRPDRYHLDGKAYSTLEEVARDYGLTKSALVGRMLTRPLEEAVRHEPANGRYTKKRFAADRALAASPGMLYFIRIGDLHKIGITANSVAARFSGRRDITLLHLTEGTLEEVYHLEQATLRTFKAMRYRAPEDFEGRTETLRLDAEGEAKVLAFLESQLNFEEMEN